MHTVTPGNSLMKYADDTYLVIPACNVDSRDKEIANIDAWAKVNNLTLNASKSVEIVFQDSRKRHRAAPPPVMHGVERVHSLKILGITFTDKLSVKEHLDDVISFLHGHCTPSGSCGLMGCRSLPCNKCSVRS